MEIDQKKIIEMKKFLIPILRRASYRHKNRGLALKAARKDRGVYECAECKGLFKQKDIVLDHREPVIPIETGFTNWDDFIYRLYCDVENYQVICTTCNSSKTLIEREMRKKYRAIRKAEGKSED